MIALELKNGGTLQNLISIYNRWGNLVFHTTNSADCWDGALKGIQQPADAYVYQIKAKTVCGKVFRKGTIILIRVSLKIENIYSQRI